MVLLITLIAKGKCLSPSNVYLGRKWVKSRQSKVGKQHFLENFYFKKRFNSILINLLWDDRKELQIVTFNKYVTCF